MEHLEAGRELAHLAHVEYCRDLTRRSGGRVLDEDGLTCLAAPHPDPHLLNVAFATDREQPAHDLFDLARAFFARAERRFSFQALVGRDEDLVDRARRLGFVGDGEPDPLQARAAAPITPIDPPGVEIRPVLDAAGVADLVLVAQAAHRAYGFPDDLFPTLFARPAAAIGPHLHAVVAYANGRPVATGTVVLTHGVSYLGWIATVPDHERGGLGSMVTAWLVARGDELGARGSVLLASPMGAPVYRRLGFVDVGGLIGLVSPG